MGIGMADTANTVFRDFVTDGVPSSGKSKPKKPEIRRLLTGYEAIISAFTSNGGLIYSSKPAMDGDLTRPANSMAWVVGDPTAINNGIYRKVGGSGTGSWARVSDLPFSFIIASDVGAGTPNAIQASTSIPVSGSALVWTNIFETNTASPVTISFNGGAALTVKTNSGNDPAPGGLPGGMIVMGTVSGSTFRLLNDQVSSAIVAAAEAAAAAAVAAKSGAEAALAAMQKGQPGGVAELDGNGRLPNGQLPPRIRAQASSVTVNANTVLDSGWYYGWSGTPGGLSNYPDNSKTWLLEVIAADIAGYGRQIAYLSHVGAVFEKWERTIVAGTFSAWTRVYRTSVEIMQVISDNSECLLAQFGLALGSTDDWRPAFNAAVAKVASLSPIAGAKIRLPPKQIRLSYVDRITANGITFVGNGKKQIQNPDQGDIIVFESGQPAFSWGTIATEATGGGLQEVSIEASRPTNTNINLIDLTNSKGAQFEDLWIREAINAAIIRGGVDVRFQNVTIGGYRGSGIKAVGFVSDGTYGTLRGDRLHLYDVTVGGHGAGNVADNTGPAISIEGYWHSVYGERIDLIQVNEGLKVDSVYSDPNYMPQFMAFDGLSIDYALNRAVSFLKGEHLWLVKPYISSALNGDLILFDAGASDMQILGGKLGFPKFRVGTLSGKGFLCQGADIHAWSQDGASSAPAFYASTSANDVRLIGNYAGRTGKLASSTSAGERFLEVQSGAACYGCVVGNNLVGLHGTYILNSGTGNITDVGNSARP